MPLSIDKSAVLHCGMRNPQYRYHLQGDLLKSTDTVSDLGILRASSGGYDQHNAEVSTKANKLSGAIMPAFHGSPRVYINIGIQYLCVTNLDVHVTNMESLMCTQ